jgi:hypothetical protein
MTSEANMNTVRLNRAQRQLSNGVYADRLQCETDRRPSMWALWRNQLSGQRPKGSRAMSQNNVSRQRRAGYCLSNSWANQQVSPGIRESSAESVRQQLIKAYLRRPILGGKDSCYDQPSSLADAIDRAERWLDGCDAVAA